MFSDFVFVTSGYDDFLLLFFELYAATIKNWLHCTSLKDKMSICFLLHGSLHTQCVVFPANAFLLRFYVLINLASLSLLLSF